jgi:hypothetical protein
MFLTFPRFSGIIVITLKKETPMTIYIANSNGDWWGTAGDYTNLYILDTQKINSMTMDTIREEWQLEDGEGLDVIDKLEKIIWEYGHEVTINVGGLE